MSAHRFGPYSCMWHVQLPLMLGVLCGTVIYVTIFRVHQRLTEKLIEIETTSRSEGVLRQIKQGLNGRRSVVKMVQVQEIPSIAGKDHGQIKQKQKTEMKKANSSSKLAPIASPGKRSQCQYMRNRFKSEFPAIVEFPMAEECGRWDSFAEEIRNCTIEYMTGRPGLRGAVDCCASGMYDMLSVTPITKGNDTEWIVFPNSPTLPCYALSVGLDGDLSTAKQMHQVLPHCEQHAAVDDKQVGKRFEDIGEAHYVSLNPRFKRRENKPGEKIDDDRVKEATLTGLLQDHVKASEIDYLFVRGEAGVEYYVLRWLLKQQKKRTGRIPICFATIDLHGPVEKFGLDKSAFDKFMLMFVQQSDYLLLRASAIRNSPSNQRIFLLNAYEPFCVEKYFGQWCQSAGSEH